jgi:hypothetical protein
MPLAESLRVYEKIPHMKRGVFFCALTLDLNTWFSTGCYACRRHPELSGESLRVYKTNSLYESTGYSFYILFGFEDLVLKRMLRMPKAFEGSGF